MLEDIRKIIRAGGYDLADLLHRIDVLYAAGRLTDGERETLYSEAREGAEPSASYSALEARVEALEMWRREVEQETPSEPSEPPVEGGEEPYDYEAALAEYPPYKAPTGAHDAYYAGDKCSFGGRKWTCCAPEGIACVWDPSTHPAYWTDEGEMPEQPAEEVE